MNPKKTIINSLLLVVICPALLCISLFYFGMLSSWKSFIAYILLVFVSILDVIQNAMMFATHGLYIYGIIPTSSPCKSRGCLGNTIECGKHNFYYNENFRYFVSIVDKDLPTIVFLHGNGEPACCWCSPNGVLGCFTQKKVNIVLVEYPGYGRRHKEMASYAFLESTREDIAKQWADISTRVNGNRMILAGASLGGGFAWSVVDRLNPQPSQLVLMNTFADLRLLIQRIFGEYITLLSYVVSSNIMQYNVKKLQRSYKGKVLVIATQDDELFPLDHLAAFRLHFTEVNKVTEFKEFVCSNGGHNGGYIYNRQWIASLDC